MRPTGKKLAYQADSDVNLAQQSPCWQQQRTKHAQDYGDGSILWGSQGQEEAGIDRRGERPKEQKQARHDQTGACDSGAGVAPRLLHVSVRCSRRPSCVGEMRRCVFDLLEWRAALRTLARERHAASRHRHTVHQLEAAPFHLRALLLKVDRAAAKG
eukprot:6213200-Pleurochrysis_carterae.AAC.5